MPPARSRCYFSAVQMKKNRPGTLLTILRETRAAPGAHGHRVPGDHHDRRPLSRSDARAAGARDGQVHTAFGAIRFKIARFGGKVVNFAPEFDDCLRAASKHGIAVKDVLVAAISAYLETRTPGLKA